jgi:hypothetical protein
VTTAAPTPLPSLDARTRALPPGARVMPTLHTLFRRELRLAPALVRAVPSGDERRAGVVADHVRLVLDVLHHHHSIEDRMLWPLLLERVPSDVAPIVELMEQQHEAAHALIEQAGTLLPALRAGDVAGAARLADVLDVLHPVLVEHLDVEEQQVMPLAGRVLTAEEWDAIGDAGRAAFPRAQGTLVLGMYAYEGSPIALAEMLADAPPPVQWLVPRLARRAFRRHSRRVHGTPAP